MIDLHTHILPAVDDGPADVETALAMARDGVERGLTVVAATPHFLNPITWADIQEKVKELRQHLAQAEIPLELVPGAELMLDTDLFQLEPGEIPTYGDAGRFCLIEFPMGYLPMYTDEVLFDLQTKGITPIIAHPERYAAVMENPSMVFGWLEQGCLVQVNTGSILGRFGREVVAAAEILLTHDWAQFVASDGHSMRRRPLDLPEAHTALVKLLGAQRARELVEDNPREMLAGSFAVKRQPREYVKKRRLFPFWR